MPTPRADTATIASGADLWAGRNAPPMSSRTALFGDSLTTHLLGYNLSDAFWINGMQAKGAQQIVANAGVSGDTIADMLARVDNAYTAGSPGLDGIDPLGAIYFRGGTNDARALTTIASLSSGYTSLLSAIKAYCDHVVILSVPPIGSADGGDYATKNSRTQDYNAWLSDYAAANAGFTYVDDTAVLRDGSGNAVAGYFIDGVHFNGEAVYLCAAEGASLLAPLYAGWAYVSPLSSDASDVYPAQPQWVTNHVNAGTGGTVGTGFTGTIPDDWSVSANGSSITGTVAIVAADGGDSNATPWIRVTPTQVTRTGAGESIRIGAALSGRTISTSDPSALDVMVEIRLNAFDAAYFSAFRLWVQGNLGDALTADLDLKMGGGPITKTVTLRHKMPRPTAVAQSSATLYWDCLIAANNTGGMGSFDFRCLTVRG